MSDGRTFCSVCNKPSGICRCKHSASSIQHPPSTMTTPSKQILAHIERSREAVKMTEHSEYTNQGIDPSNLDYALIELARTDLLKYWEATARLLKLVEFIKDECDWESGGGQIKDGGDERIGPAIYVAMEEVAAMLKG